MTAAAVTGAAGLWQGERWRQGLRGWALERGRRPGPAGPCETIAAACAGPFGDGLSRRCDSPRRREGGQGWRRGGGGSDGGNGRR